MKVKMIVTKTEEAEIGFSGAILLSKDEAECLLSEEERKYKSFWWLCTPGDCNNLACFVYNYGYVNNSGYYVNNGYDIRPALIISNLGNFHIGDTFYLDKWEFKIISPTLAWMYKGDIGISKFGDTNDYTTSKVKKIVDEWYAKLVQKEYCVFDRLQKIANELGYKIVPSDEKMDFKKIFGFDLADIMNMRLDDI